MKFLVPNYSRLQNPWLGSYRPQIPVLSVLCLQLNLLNPPPEKKKFLGRPLAGYTMFRVSVKGTGYPLHSPVSPSFPLSCVTVCHHIPTGVYNISVALTKGTNTPASRKAAAAIKDRILLGQTNWENIASHCEWRIQNEECNVIVECATVVIRVPDDLLNRSILVWQWLRLYLRVPFSGPYLKHSLVPAIRNKSAWSIIQQLARRQCPWMG